VKAELVSVGTELLLGQIVDTNAAYLSRRLAELGVDVYQRQTVGDNQARLVKTLQQAVQRSDLVLVTGGLGPTPDDVTREALAELAGVELVEKPELRAELEAFFERRGRKMTAINLKQARLPEGAEALPNPMGTAPGIWLPLDRMLVVSMPGVPHEMERMFEEQVVPRLLDFAKGTLMPVFTRTLRCCGIGESTLAARLADLLENQTNPTLGTMASSGEVKLRLAVKAADAVQAESLLRPVLDEVLKRLGKHVFGYDRLTLEGALLRRLKTLGLSLAIAESCTGGLVSGRLTGVPGASKVFKGGVVAYSNEAKQDLLGVQAETLKKHGAVSEQVALELAKGAAKRFGAEVAAGITGLAGPTGGTPEKPVGTVWMGFYFKGETWSRHQLFHGDRWMVRNWAAQQALASLWDKVGEPVQVPPLSAPEASDGV